MKYLISNKALFCFPLILIGFLDLVTTIVGVAFFGATEVNPLFSGLIQTNMMLFLVIKASTVMLTGVIFYKGASIAEISHNGSNNGLRFLEIGYFASLTLLTLIVANNMLTIFQLA